jgi:5-hydroxyisourate hydrolase
MSGVSTHVLDTSRGRPAGGLSVLLEAQGDDGAWNAVGRGTTDSDGRVRQLVPAGSSLRAGLYRLTFDTKSYFAAQKTEAFYPQVTVVFTLADPAQPYHVPLLLSPFGYSTYRGS